MSFGEGKYTVERISQDFGAKAIEQDRLEFYPNFAMSKFSYLGLVSNPYSPTA